MSFRVEDYLVKREEILRGEEQVEIFQSFSLKS